jgi:virginiamycin B lyase
LVYRPERQHGGTSRSQERRNQARHLAHAEFTALWPPDQFQGHSGFLEFGTNKIATVDPNTMAIKEYALPNAASRPRRFALTPDDAVWYADFSRGYLGRLDLATGEHKEWPSPSGPQSQPYGIVFAKGALWYNESGAKPNTIVRFDPKTEKFQSWAIPGGGDIVRNMSVTPEGNPVTANSLVNEVGMVEVK